MDNIDVMLISGATDTLDDNSITNIQSFMNSGKNIFMAQGAVLTDMQVQQANPINSNIFSLLSSIFSFEAQLDKNTLIQNKSKKNFKE